jgi:hypothetical protein
MKREDFELNPDSDRYRECLNCKAPFMATHRSRKFCDNDNWCHNEYHNRLKKESMEVLVNTKVKIGSLEWNIKMFDGVEFQNGRVELNLIQLNSLGVNLNNYSSIIDVSPNEKQNFYVLIFGEYSICKISNEAFRLSKEQKNKL